MTPIVRDEAGRTVRLPRPPRRVVSLVPGVTETLFALGLGDRLCGVTRFCNHPPEAAAVPCVGGVLDPDLDRLRDLRPDLVLASVSENRRDCVEAIEAASIPVFVTDPRTVDSALASIETMAFLFEAGEAGRALVGRLRSEAAALPAPDRLLPVLFPVWNEPLIVPGRSTFVADLLRRGGALSVGEEAGEGWTECTPDFLDRCGARAVILPSEPYDWGEEGRRRWLADTRLGAAAAGRVFLVDGECTNRPGPRMIEGVRAVRDIVLGCAEGAK